MLGVVPRVLGAVGLASPADRLGRVLQVFRRLDILPVDAGQYPPPLRADDGHGHVFRGQTCAVPVLPVHDVAAIRVMFSFPPEARQSHQLVRLRSATT